MPVATASDLGKDIAGQPLLRGVSFKLERRDRMTLSGRNGSGKTTLLRILAGQAGHDGGKLSLQKGAKVALHDQRPPRERDVTLREYVLSGAVEVVAIEQELARLEQLMAQDDAGEQTEPLGKLIPTLERLLEQTEPLGKLIPTLERLLQQTEPLGKLIPTLERLLQQTEPLGKLIPTLERLLQQTEPLGELLPALERLEERLGTRLDSVHEVVVALEGEDSHLNTTVAELAREVAAMHKSLSGLQDDVQSVTDRLPDASRGPLEKARDVLTSGAAQEKE